MELELPEGSLLALCTDGLIEAGDHDIDVGTRRLGQRPGATGSLSRRALHQRDGTRAMAGTVRRRHTAPRPDPFAQPRPGRLLDASQRSGRCPARAARGGPSADRMGAGDSGRLHGTDRQRTGGRRRPVQHRADRAAPDPTSGPHLRGARYRLVLSASSMCRPSKAAHGHVRNHTVAGAPAVTGSGRRRGRRVCGVRSRTEACPG
ncbi:hypothetical protein [Streptomyces sp. NPDC088358]|uniref:hypothetical protein n=1 Tax=Streptomyces sp. NPDC088358 TaxID=3365857 RepID=UPI0038037D6B